MKHLMILLVGVCLLLTSVPSMADQAADEAAVRKAVEKLAATFSSHDIETMLTLMDENNVPWEGGDKGRAAQEKRMREGFNSQYKNVKGKLTQEIGIVFVTPDVAIYKAHVETSGLVSGEGKPLPPMTSLGAWVMKKKDGKWLMAAYFGRPVEE